MSGAHMPLISVAIMAIGMTPTPITTSPFEYGKREDDEHHQAKRDPTHSRKPRKEIRTCPSSSIEEDHASESGTDDYRHSD